MICYRTIVLFLIYTNDFAEGFSSNTQLFTGSTSVSHYSSLINPF